MTIRPRTVRLRLSLLVVLVFGAKLVAACVLLARQVERVLVPDTREAAIQQLTFQLTGVPAGFEGDASDQFRFYDTERGELKNPILVPILSGRPSIRLTSTPSWRVKIRSTSAPAIAPSFFHNDVAEHTGRSCAVGNQTPPR